ncbi:MAG: DUF3068 domain-containing protein [Gordonia polyisoprenivorans]|nr:DUF3068 domain-containing protein [Gordonia polyisoprenivorans]
MLGLCSVPVMASTSKRAFGLLGIAGGAGLIAVAVLLPTVVVPGAKHLPAHISQNITAEASNAQVLDNAAIAAGQVRTETDVPLRVDIRVQSGPPTSADRVTIIAAARTSRTDRAGEAGVISAYIDRVTLNRETARPERSPSPVTLRETAGTARPTPRTGYQYNFPLGVKKRAYPLYDTETQTSPDAKFVDDTRKINGVRVFHFRQVITNDNLYERLGSIASVTVAGKAVGQPTQALVRLDLTYSVTRDVWVEPNTGQIVDETQLIHRELVNGSFRATSLLANIKFSPASVLANARMASSNVQLLRWGTLWAPLILGLVGLVLLMVGAVLLRRAPSDAPE